MMASLQFVAVIDVKFVDVVTSQVIKRGLAIDSIGRCVTIA